MNIRNLLRSIRAEYRGIAAIAARAFALHTVPDYRLNQILFEDILFNIALAACPSVIVELGTGRGGSKSSRAFRRALKVMRRRGHGGGHLYTCDVDPVAIELLAGKSQVSGFNVTTNQFAAVWRDQINKPIDLLFIDADHSHEQSLKDFLAFAPFVRPNGLCLMHDTHPVDEDHEKLRYSGEVWRTASYIKRHCSDEWEISTLPFLSGISILRKAGSKYF